MEQEGRNMSECVVRMKMPSNCEKCPMCGTESGGNGVYKLWCMCVDIPASSWRRPKDCPIICSLPKGHGRLVDADDVNNHIMGYVDLRDSPIIVPAERSEK